MTAEIKHYSGDTPCPDCQGAHDPETGFCEDCEGEVELYHVFAVGKAWPGVPKTWTEGLVSRRGVGERVLGLLPDAAYVVVKRS